MDDNHTNDIQQLKDEIHKLNHRVDTLTIRLNTLSAPATETRPAPAQSSQSPQQSPTQPPLHTNPSPTQHSQTQPATSSSTERVQNNKPTPKRAPQPQYEIPSIKSRPIPQQSKPAFDPSKLEWMMGIKGLTMLGVLIFIIGITSMFVYAHSQGWIGQLSPTFRCSIVGAFGLVLVGAGETLRKKINANASTGFTSAGIITIYSSIFAANTMFELISPTITFVLLGGVSIIGIYLGALSNRVFLSLLSLLGAFAVPLLLRSETPSTTILPGYLLFLLFVGLTLSGWKGGHYAHARKLSWWATGIIGTLWITSIDERFPISAIVFISLAWLMTITELAISSRFFSQFRPTTKWSPSSQSGFLRSDSGEITFNLLSIFAPESRWINTIFGATIWSVIAMSVVIRAHNPELQYLAPLSFGLISAIIVLPLCKLTHIPIGSSSVLTPRTASPLSLYASSLIINSIALGTTAILIALGGWIEVITWLALGLSAIEISRRFKFRAIAIFGMSLISYASLRLLTLDLINWFDSNPINIILGIGISGWTIQMLITSIVFAIGSYRFPTRNTQTDDQHLDLEELVHLGLLKSLAPISLWFITLSMLHTDTTLGSFASANMILATLTIWICTRLKSDSLRTNAFVLSGLSTALILIAQIDPESNSSSIPEHIMLIPLTICAFSWISIGLLPKSSLTLRGLSSTIAAAVGSIAIIKLDQTQSTFTMLLAQSIYIGILIALGKKLYRYMLPEISSIMISLLAIIWIMFLISNGNSSLELTPFGGSYSFAPLTILITLLYGARTIPTRNIPQESSADALEVRKTLSSTMFGGAWLFALIISTIEMIRITGLYFTSDSAMSASVSIWWSVFAIVSISLGFKLPRQLRWAGLTLLCIVGAKVLLLDTVTLSPPARIIALISVGLIIITTGVVYSKVVDSMTNAENPEKDTKGPKNSSENKNNPKDNVLDQSDSFSSP